MGICPYHSSRGTQLNRLALWNRSQVMLVPLSREQLKTSAEFCSPSCGYIWHHCGRWDLSGSPWGAPAGWLSMGSCHRPPAMSGREGLGKSPSVHCLGRAIRTHPSKLPAAWWSPADTFLLTCSENISKGNSTTGHPKLTRQHLDKVRK